MPNTRNTHRYHLNTHSRGIPVIVTTHTLTTLSPLVKVLTTTTTTTTTLLRHHYSRITLGYLYACCQYWSTIYDCSESDCPGHSAIHLISNCPSPLVFLTITTATFSFSLTRDHSSIQQLDSALLLRIPFIYNSSQLIAIISQAAR